jgi:hypothetical protein
MSAKVIAIPYLSLPLSGHPAIIAAFVCELEVMTAAIIPRGCTIHRLKTADAVSGACSQGGQTSRLWQPFHKEKRDRHRWRFARAESPPEKQRQAILPELPLAWSGTDIIHGLRYMA